MNSPFVTADRPKSRTSLSRAPHRLRPGWYNPNLAVSLQKSTAVFRRVFKAFEYRDFRVMWIGACTSTIGTWMQIVAQAWLVYEISHSPFLLGLDTFLGGIPIFLFSLFGGVLADRSERRKMLLASQWVQMGSAFILTALVVLHAVRIWQILTLSFVSGFAQAFGGPAYQSLIPTLVRREDMPNAIALNSIQFNAATIIGPTLGGIAMAKLGDAWCFGLNGLSFFAPIFSLSILTLRFIPEKTGDSILSSMKEGFRFIRKREGMVALMVLAFCMTFLAVPMRTFLPVFAEDIFHHGPETYTSFVSVIGVGSVFGALLVAWLGQIRQKARVALIMLIILGSAMAGFAVSKVLALSFVILFFCGASMIGVFTMVSSLVQLITTNEMRGRVVSLYNFAFRGGMPMGNLVTGLLVPKYTAPVVLAVNGMVLVLLGIYFLTAQRKVAAL
jgi:MFS family permease